MRDDPTSRIARCLSRVAAFLRARARDDRGGRAGATPAIDADDIGGVVNGPAGPEAGVWVIAETNDLGTRFAKIVVTDDQGRYVVPDLPAADYQRLGPRLRPRRFGQSDGSSGPTLASRETRRHRRRAAAVVYPAIYWYSMMKVPSADEVSSCLGRREPVPRIGQESVVHRLPSDRPARDALRCRPHSGSDTHEAWVRASSPAKPARRCSRPR